MATIAQIKQMAENAAKFQSEDVFYQMDYCQDNFFVVSDDVGNEIHIDYEEVDLSKESFWALRKMEVRS